jgi:UPF0716 protein FxsA
MPVLELVVAIQVAGALGTTATVLLVLAGCAAGLLVLRFVGLQAVRTLSRPPQGRPPGAPSTDGVFLVVSGLLLLLPGLVTDVVALLLFLPPVRALLRRRVASAVNRRIRTATQRRVVTGEAVEVEVIEIRDAEPRQERDQNGPGRTGGGQS